MCPWPVSINTPLVRAMSCKSRVSQFSGIAENVREARVCGLSRLPAVLPGAPVREVPAVSPPQWRLIFKGHAD
jgi:hypothetical protein